MIQKCRRVPHRLTASAVNTIGMIADAAAVADMAAIEDIAPAVQEAEADINVLRENSVMIAEVGISRAAAVTDAKAEEAREAEEAIATVDSAIEVLNGETIEATFVLVPFNHDDR